MIWWGGGGGGNRFCCSVGKYNVLDTKGEDVAHGGDFLKIWVLNTGFCVHY